MDNTTTNMSDTSNEKMRDSSSGEINPEINPAAGTSSPSFLKLIFYSIRIEY
jgi:hypothetical protein